MDIVDDKVSLSDSDEDYHCVVCFELYKTPCLLDCKHTFCKNCCEGMSIKCHQASLLFCPLCRSITPWSKMRPLRVNTELAQRVDAMVAVRNSQVISRSAVIPAELTALLLQRLSQKEEPRDSPKIDRLKKMIGKALKTHNVQVAVSLKIGEAGAASPLDRCKNVTIKLEDLFDVRSAEDELLRSQDAVFQLGVKHALSQNTNTERIRVVLTLKGPRSSVKAAITELGQGLGEFQEDLIDGNLSNKSRCRFSCGLFRMWACCVG